MLTPEQRLSPEQSPREIFESFLKRVDSEVINELVSLNSAIVKFSFLLAKRNEPIIKHFRELEIQSVANDSKPESLLQLRKNKFDQLSPEKSGSVRVRIIRQNEILSRLISNMTDEELNVFTNLVRANHELQYGPKIGASVNIAEVIKGIRLGNEKILAQDPKTKDYLEFVRLTLSRSILTSSLFIATNLQKISEELNTQIAEYLPDLLKREGFATIGRSSDSNISLALPFISRKHIELESVKEGELVITNSSKKAKINIYVGSEKITLCGDESDVILAPPNTSIKIGIPFEASEYAFSFKIPSFAKEKEEKINKPSKDDLDKTLELVKSSKSFKVFYQQGILSVRSDNITASYSNVSQSDAVNFLKDLKKHFQGIGPKLQFVEIDNDFILRLD